jgi:hypothetical protein
VTVGRRGGVLGGEGGSVPWRTRKAWRPNVRVALVHRVSCFGTMPEYGQRRYLVQNSTWN